METSPEEVHPRAQPQEMKLAESPAVDEVSERIVLNTGNTSVIEKKEHRRNREVKEKHDAKRKSSRSSSKHRKRRSDKQQVDDNHHVDGSKERHHRKRRHRKESRRKKCKDLDPNDPETIAKSRDLLLLAMGVKKQPDIEPCFVNANAKLDNNPIYQHNKQRLVSTLSESLLTQAASEAEFVDALHINIIHASGTSVGEPHDSVDNEYDQFVDF